MVQLAMIATVRQVVMVTAVLAVALLRFRPYIAFKKSPKNGSESH